ncbi:MAG: hypothetical protein IJ501_03050 [Bacilli bacterium]|nr:hypothetical protein [Bacilli bacterium]
MADKYSIRCLNEHFLRTCGSCVLLNSAEAEDKNGDGKAYCSYVNYKHRLDEPIKNCRKYEGPLDPNKRDYTKLYYNLHGKKYFILTVICEVLGISEDYEFYQEIKTLIQLVRQDSTTEKEAVGYDTFGPEIADNLLRDPNVIELCKSLLTNYLTRAFILIKENKQEEAIQVYKDMVTFLFIRYRNVENYSNLISGESFENPKVLIRK